MHLPLRVAHLNQRDPKHDDEQHDRGSGGVANVRLDERLFVDEVDQRVGPIDRTTLQSSPR